MWAIPVLALLATGPDPREELSQRILDVSARFLGTPYVHSPLGEGEGVDPDPAIRFDAVDCLTFVEQTLALAVAQNPAQVPHHLRALRYAQVASYADRNHLMEAQWLPNNVRKGYLRELTATFGGPSAVRVGKTLSEVSWASESSRLLQLPDDRHLTGTFEMDVIPLRVALERRKEIPDATILLVVREDRPGKVTRITHLGFVLQKKGRTFLRHAGRAGHRRVVDEDLETFLTRNSRYTKWPVVGVALLEPLSPQGRDAAPYAAFH